jgi:hypothetical protein
MLLLCFSAFAIDVFPGVGQPSAVPRAAGSATVELATAHFTRGGLVHQGSLTTLAGTWSPHQHVQLGVQGLAARGAAGVMSSSWGSAVDVTATFGVDLVRRSDVRLTLVAGLGTAAQAGLAFWYQMPEAPWMLDATWQPGVDVDFFGLPIATALPEMGVTWAPVGQASSVRWGFVGLETHLSYRHEWRGLAVECAGGVGPALGYQGRVALSARH